MIDYALKPPISSQEINIELINSSPDYLKTMKPEEQSLFNKSYKYPYLLFYQLKKDNHAIKFRKLSRDIYTPW